MTGDKHIINLRLKGLTPEWVFINDYPCQAPTDDNNPNVCVYGDSIESLDLRFLVNLRVSVSTDDESRCKALLNACKRYASEVAAGVSQQGYEQNGFSEVWKNGIPN